MGPAGLRNKGGDGVKKMMRVVTYLQDRLGTSYH